MITTLQPGSPAEKAGLQKGDVITQINGKAPRDFIQCAEWLSAGAKQELTLAVQRNGARRLLTARMVPLADLIRERLGLSAQQLSRELAENFGYQPRDGLLVAGVDADGPAARAELRPGDLIAGIDGVATPDLVAAAGVLAPKKKGDWAELTVATHRRSAFGRVINQGNVAVRVR